MTGRSDYIVKDIGLAEFGRKEISIAETDMPGLMAIGVYRDMIPAAGPEALIHATGFQGTGIVDPILTLQGLVNVAEG